MVRWLAVDKQGRIVAYLPGITAGGPLRRTMGRIETLSATLTVDATTDPSWDFATSPYECALLAYDGDPGYEAVVWGGIVETHDDNLLGNTITLGLVSFEGYLDRCYVGEYQTYPDLKHQSGILYELVNEKAGQPAGWPVDVEFQSPANPYDSRRRQRRYTDDQDKTVYSAVSELAAVEGGPQWMMSWHWWHDRTPNEITPILAVGDRVGRAAVDGRAVVTFTSEMMLKANRLTDYGKGKGANVVTATSSPAGVRLARTVTAAGEQPTRPHVEHRFTPSTSITDPDTLTEHAARALEVMRDGAQVISFVLSRAAAPRVGIEWGLGDDIGYSITGPLLKEPLTGVGQCIGYDLTETTITPYLASVDQL
jgi:hypothetical protein